MEKYKNEKKEKNVSNTKGTYLKKLYIEDHVQW